MTWISSNFRNKRLEALLCSCDTHRTWRLQEDGDLLILQHQLQEQPTNEARDVS